MLNVLPGYDPLQVNVEDLFSSLHGWLVNDNMPIESTRTQKCFIENVWSICASNDNDLLRGVETIHFSQDLIQRTFSLVVATPETLLCSRSANGVYFVDENDTWRVLSCRSKQ